MKFGFRTPSFKKSFAARTSIKRKVMPRMPRGLGILRNPKKALYNKVYNRTTVSIFKTSRKKGKQSYKSTSEIKSYQSSPIKQKEKIIVKCPECNSTKTLNLKEGDNLFIGMFGVSVILALVFSYYIFILSALLLPMLFVKRKFEYKCEKCKTEFDITNPAIN